MISAPTNPVSINCVGTGVLDRPLIQRNLRTVREAGPYEHRVRLCEIKEPDNPEFVVYIILSSQKKNKKQINCFLFLALIFLFIL